MTVIATDGKTIAADKRAGVYGRSVPVTKLYRSKDIETGKPVVIGISGCWVYSKRLLKWYEQGADIEKIPDAGNTDYDMIIVSKGSIKGLFKHGIAGIDANFWAIGSGGNYAEMAMLLGLSPKEAVLKTCELDSACGLGVDVMELE